MTWTETDEDLEIEIIFHGGGRQGERVHPRRGCLDLNYDLGLSRLKWVMDV